MRTKLFLVSVLFFIISSHWCSADAAPDIIVGENQGTVGQTISIPIDFTSGGSSAHIQFDLSYDSSVLTPGSPTGGNASAGHVVDSNPIGAGHLRFVIYSVSNALLGSGRLIDLPFSIASDATPDVYPLTLSAVMISDPTGQSVAPTLLTDGNVEVIEESASIPAIGPFGLLLLACLIACAGIMALKNRNSTAYRILVLFVLVNFSISSLGILPALAAWPGDSDDDGDIDADDIRLTVGVILERSIAPGDPDCNTDARINVLDLPCQIRNIGNEPPDLIPPGNREIAADTDFSSRLFAIDPDPGDELTFSLSSAPAGMTCDPATGNLQWSPLEIDIGDHGITARVADKAGQSDSETFTIHVYQTIHIGNDNSAPDLSPIPDQNLTVGDSLNIAVTAVDPDAGDVLTYSLPRNPDGMTIDGSSGQIQWAPGADKTGDHDVTVMVADNGGLTDAEAFTVTVKSQNRAPVANDDIYVARMGETLTVPAPGVLENDTDPDGDPIQATLVQEPDNGTLNLNPDGSFDYTLTAPQVTANIKEVNQSMWLRPYKRATDMMSPYDYSYGADGNLNTSWIADADVDSFTYYLRFDGELRPTVKELRLYGNRGDIADGHDIYSGRFRLIDENNVLLYESEELDLAPPDRDLIFPIPGGPVGNVYRVEFIFSEFENKGNTEEPLPQPGFAELEVISDQEVLDVQEEWAFSSSLMEPESLKVISAPLVGDINNDEMPDILFVTYITGNYGILRAVSGNDGSEIFVANDIDGSGLINDRLEYSTSLAIGDIDLDGYPEILGFYSNYIKSFQYDINSGEIVREWTSEEIPNPRDGGMSIADLDADGIPEIIAASRGELTVLNNDGSIRSQSPLYDSTGYRIKFPFAVDLNLDGTMEILSGQMAYTANGDMHWPTPDPSLGDGHNAVGNFDNDPYPEVVLMSPQAGGWGVHVLEHDGTIKWGRVRSDGEGPPTVADFDGDGLPEIGVAGKHRYQVIDTDGSVLWERKIQDITSYHTGSSVFDFDGDGSAEVVFSDELDLIIFRGSDGAILFRTPIGSGTRWEYPVVADVDADGHAEIVAVANHGDEPANKDNGLYVFGGPDSNWVPTRKIWNQHAYHITNVNDDLTIPAVQQYNWLISGLNNFRANVPYMDENGTADQFTYKADDGLLESNEPTVFIDIHPPNTAPVIVSTPQTNGTAGFDYTYWVVAHDPDNDPLTYSLTDAPAGMSIDPLIGKINWAPENGDLGDHPVMVSVSDAKGGVSIQTYTLAVGEPVTVPDVVGETRASAETQIGAAGLDVGTITEGFHITVAAGLVAHQSPPGDTSAEPGSDVDIVLSLGPAPEDVDNDGDGFTENEGDCNDSDDTIHPGANDPPGDGIDQDCDGLDGNLPIVEISIIPASNTLLVGDSVAGTAVAVFDDGTSQQVTSLAAWNSLDPGKATVDGNGHITAAGAGSVTIQATLKGITGSAVFDIHDVTAGDVTPPTAVISSPESSSTITAPMDITGTANDADFLKYTLSIALAGETEFTQIHTGTAPVAGDVLGQFDPTLLLNDLYTLRLTVYDTGGNVTVAESVYQVDENFKVGLFTLTFADLDIPLAGIPIQILRTYDSRDKSKGDFGVGWQLDIQTLRCRSNRIMGTGWQVLKSGLAYQMFSTDFHKISITLPDGQVEEFDMTISPNPSLIVPFTSVNAGFQARPGTVGTLECLDDTALLVIGAQPGDVTLTDFGGNTFNPQNFRYTSLSGMQYVINKSEGVKSVTDTNGNTLTFGPGGITHSSGKSVLFARDALDRITSITDPDGNIQTYSYDGNGNLHSHTDAETNTTRFFYNYRHGLLRIEDPLGRVAARNEYDGTGRLIASIDALGNRIAYTHNIGSRQEVVRDRRGGITVHEYDESGNVISQTDALGNITTFAYDVHNNKISKTDANGNTTAFTYNSLNQVLTRTDPLGNSTTFAYDESGQVVSFTDPLGNVVKNEYDLHRNASNEIDQLGGNLFYIYDNAGNVLTKTNDLGHITSFEYDSYGNKIKEIDPRGNITTFTYDLLNRKTSKTKKRTTPAGTETLVWQWKYDAKSRTVEEIFPDGTNVEYQYDAVGKKTSMTNRNGFTTTYEYDARGNLTKVVHPNGVIEEYRYDAQGNKIWEKCLQCSGTGSYSYEYDALNRRVKTVFADGSQTREVYDAVGNTIEKYDQNGKIMQFEYDAAGRNTKIIDALGNATQYTYDAGGRRTAILDALGKTSQYEYNAANVMTKIVFPDTTAKETAYDSLGRKVAETDQAGLTTQYEYNAMGLVTKLIDPAGYETRFVYDELGNKIEQIDANGNITRWTYNKTGNILSHTLPLGMTESFLYDAGGKLVTKTDFNGDTTAYAHDENGFLTSKTYPDGSTETYTYTESGKRESTTNTDGTTYYFYDSRDRLIEEIKPDGDYIKYAYDAVGNRLSVTTSSGSTIYGYDALNRINKITDRNGKETQYDYDAAGNRIKVVYANGVQTIYQYDDLNRLTFMENARPDLTVISSYQYTLGPAGNRLQVIEQNGRKVDYAYDNLYRLTSEDITDSINGDETIAYAYDAFGNRLSRADNSGTTVYSYDANSRLMSETAPSSSYAYMYDANGNQVGRDDGIAATLYHYNSKNQLIQVESAGSLITYEYDMDGLRTEQNVNGVETGFLFDKNRRYAQVLEEKDDSKTVQAEYVWGDTLDPIFMNRTGNYSYYMADGNMNIRQLVNETRNITDTYDLDAFGNLINRTGITENQYLLHGQHYDANAGFYYMRARWMDPKLGRFISRDAFAGSVFEPQSLHNYVFAWNNPLLFYDPSGMITVIELNIVTVISAVLVESLIILWESATSPRKLAEYSTGRAIWRLAITAVFAELSFLIGQAALVTFAGGAGAVGISTIIGGFVIVYGSAAFAIGGLGWISCMLKGASLNISSSEAVSLSKKCFIQAIIGALFFIVLSSGSEAIGKMGNKVLDLFGESCSDEAAYATMRGLSDEVVKELGSEHLEAIEDTLTETTGGAYGEQQIDEYMQEQGIVVSY